MSLDNRFAAPKSAIAASAPIAIPIEKLREAHTALNRSRMGFVAFFIGFVAMGYIDAKWASLVLSAMFFSVLMAHIFLGAAATRSGRSWVWFSLLPVLVPVLGGLISFGVLRSKVPYDDA